MAGEGSRFMLAVGEAGHARLCSKESARRGWEDVLSRASRNLECPAAQSQE